MTKIRNRYSQAPHPTQYTNVKSTTSKLDITNESQEVSDHLGAKLGGLTEKLT